MTAAAPAPAVAGSDRLAEALRPWTPADLARLLRFAADGHDVSLGTDGPRPARSRFFGAGWFAVFDRVHLSGETAPLLVEAGLLARHELRFSGNAYVTADVARELADAVEFGTVAP